MFDKLKKYIMDNKETKQVKKEFAFIKGVIYKNGKALNITEPQSEGDCLGVILNAVQGNEYKCETINSVLTVTSNTDKYETLVG